MLATSPFPRADGDQMTALKYLAGCPEHLQVRVRELLGLGRLGAMLAEKYAAPHAVRNDRQLYDYLQELKYQHLCSAAPLGRWATTPPCS